MPLLSRFDVFIFDCDGVIFNSNELKVEAMRYALEEQGFEEQEVQNCIDYFAKNFGLSRYHHVNYFVDNLLTLTVDDDREAIVSRLLNSFGLQCKQLYVGAELTPGILAFIELLPGDKYIASGSAETELREVFELRGINHLFKGIYGSPTKKTDLVKNILDTNPGKSAVMFGDALSDLQASKSNGIDFIGYLPFSNVRTELINAAQDHNYLTVNQWSELV